MTTTPAVDSLLALGFTETEAQVYCALVASGALSGYRLAQSVGKARANVYQALATLSQKGAVLVDGGDVRIFRATPPTELLAAIERTFAERSRKAEAALSALAGAEADDRIYQLSTVDQVLQRATAMIDGAVQIVLVDSFAAPLARIRSRLDAAVARGVTVAVLAYEEAPPSPFPIVRSAGAAFVNERWPGLQLTVVADAREHLVSLLSFDMSEVRRGLWSDSALLSCLQHSGLAAEIQLARLQSGGEPIPSISLLRAYPPGLARLVGPQPELGANTADGEAVA